MPQRHYMQLGIFHVTTNAADKTRWCTKQGIPEILIETLFIARSLHDARLYAFCVLPTHMHIILSPGKKGLSSFMHSFKTNSSKNVRKYLQSVHTERSRCTAIFSGWQNGFYDERIRTRRQCGAAMAYVRGNAARHGIVKKPASWPWSSIHFEQDLNRMEMWLD